MTQRDEKIFYNNIYPHFEKICAIPHASNEEAEITEFLINFAKNHNLRYEVDALYNLVIYRDGCGGSENAEPLMFQGHTDMVSVPDKNIWPIKPVITDGWVHTEEKSTLGADNGIAAAMMMELMIMDFEQAPPMEFMFTSAEEVGLIGASGMETEKFTIKSPRMINIDSEDINFVTVGCAGSKNFDITLDVNRQVSELENLFEIVVKGPGGHSGIAINDDIPNAIQLAAKAMQKVFLLGEAHLCHLEGGLARNAIPADARFVFSSKYCDENNLEAICKEVVQENNGLQEFTISSKHVEKCNKVIILSQSSLIIDVLLTIPHGVIKMNPDTGGVYSSNNLAEIELTDEKLSITMSARSCELSAVDEIFNDMQSSLMMYNGVQLSKDEGYPGWRPNVDSKLLAETVDSFEKLLGHKPEYLDIHAGLECGILMDRFPQIKEAVSIGPNLHQVHSVKERLEVATTIDIWNIILDIIKKYSK